MAWTTPRTWTTGETVTAAIMNTHVRDNLDFLHGHHGCRVFKSANQTVTSGSNDVLSWNSEDYDTDAIHSTVTNNSRLIVPSGFGGYWLFYLEAQVDADAANHNSFLLSLRLNAAGSGAGGTLLDSKRWTGHTNVHSGTVRWQGNLIAGDYVEGFFAATGENMDAVGGTDASNMLATFLGA